MPSLRPYTASCSLRASGRPASSPAVLQAAANSFEFDDAVVARLVHVRIVHVAELHHFARRDEVDRIGHHRDDGAVAGAHHQLEGAGVEEVAHEDAGGVAEGDIGRGFAAAQRRFIDDVIMQQGGVVDEFDEGGGGNGVFAAVVAEAAAQQGQERAEALAAVADGVLHHQFCQRDFGLHFRAHQRFGRLHILLHQLPYRLVTQSLAHGGVGFPECKEALL